MRTDRAVQRLGRSGRLPARAEPHQQRRKRAWRARGALGGRHRRREAASQAPCAPRVQVRSRHFKPDLTN